MSSIKLRKLQIGLSSDASKNVTLYQSDVEDGVLRFGTGDESTLTEAFSIDNSGSLSLSSANLSSADVSDFDSAAKNAVDKTHVDGLGVDASTVGGLSTSQLWNVNNDGAGSGLDADTIDGVESSAFALLSGANFSGDVTVSGNFTVSGTTTTVDTTNTNVQDAVLTLNSGQSTPLNDVGLLFQRYASADATNYNVGLAWDESADKLVLGKTPEDGADNDLSFDAEWLTVDGNGDAVFGNDVTVTNDLTVSNAATVTSDLTVNGNLISPNRPAFWAYEGGEISGTTSAVVFTQTDINVGNNYSTSTGRFTAPVSGLYLIFGSALNRVNNIDGSSEISFYVNGSNISSRGLAYHSPGEANNSEHDQMFIQIIRYLNSGDYITLGIHANSGDLYFKDRLAYFGGYLIG